MTVMLLTKKTYLPIRKNEPSDVHERIIRSRWVEAVLLMSFVLLVIFQGKQFSFYQIQHVRNDVPAATLVIYNGNTAGRTKMPAKERRFKRKAFKKYLKQQLRAVKKKMKEELSTGEKILYTTFLIILILALIAFMLYISCSLDCAGSGVLAALVIATGTPGIILLGIFGFRKIFAKKKVDR